MIEDIHAENTWEIIKEFKFKDNEECKECARLREGVGSLVGELNRIEDMIIALRKINKRCAKSCAI